MTNKFLFLAFLFLICFSVTAQSLNNYTSELEHNSELTGLWLEAWSHSEEHDMYFPGSYGAYENPNWESFYYFKADGTGYYFERSINITSSNSSHNYEDIIGSINSGSGIEYQVVVRENNNYIEKDELSKIRRLYWGITSDNQIKLVVEDYQGELITSYHDYNYNPSDPRSDSFKRTIDGYRLGVELQIIWIASLKKISENDSEELLTRYGLE